MANSNFLTVFISIIYLFLLTFSSHAAILKGHVIDMDTHEHIAGAFVDVIGTKNIYVSDVNGYFEFDDLSKGTYVLSARMLGYKSSVTDAIEINSNDAVVVFDILKKSESRELNDVEVKGVKNKETDVSARLDEKMASNVINIISAKTIEQLPDLNVADVMQRVSGVSMVKNSTGDNTEAIIRGMPPRYSSTMINGTEAPSTSGSTRSVSLDMIPSSLVGRIEVTKALTPDQEANGLGGTVNIEMKDAPANPLFYIDLSSGYNQYFFSHDIYTFNTSIVNMKDPAESNLAKYPDYTYVSNLSDFTRPNMLVTTKNPLPSINGNFAFGHRFFHDKLGVLISATVNNKSEGSIDYFLDPLPNHNNSLDIDSRNKREYDTQTMTIGSNVKLDYQLDKNNKISLYNSFFQMIQDRVRMESDTSVDIQGRVGSQVVTNIDISTLNSTNLQGHHQLNPHLDLDWSLIYSVATSQSPDLVTESFFQIILPKVQPLYLNYNGSLTREWQHNTDENKTAYLNLKYKTTLFDHFFEFKAGGMFRDKYRNNYANEYSFDAPIVNPPYPDMNTVVMRQNGNVQQANGNPINNPGNYKATEDIEAGYIQLKTSFGKLQILTGVRMEFTQQTNFHSETQYVQVPFTRNVYGYYDLLPSLHLNYKATEDQNIRLSVYQGISRPNYTELVDYLAQGVNGGYQGNKYLRHSTGTCFDTRYEIYPEKEEVFTAGIFYKYIQRPIEDVLGANNNITPSNGPNCANYGFELVGIKYLGNFGVSANYTYTKSVINVSKIFYLPTDSVNPSRRNETRPLVGQSPHIINLALIYRDVKNGLKFQVVYTMQGENIKKTSEYYGEDVYQKTFHDVGATFEKNITKKFYVYAKGSNLLNSKLQFQTKSGINLENISTSASYLIGLKYNF